MIARRMARKTWSSSALGRYAALLPLLCAPLSAASASQGVQDSRADVAAKLARVDEVLKTKLKQDKGWGAARKALDKELVEIELWLIGEAPKLGAKDRAATVKTVGPVLLEARPIAWASEVGQSIQVNAAEVLGLIVPEGAPALLAGAKALDSNKDPVQVWRVYCNVGKQGTAECFAALIAAAAMKEESHLLGAADGLAALPAPSAQQRKAGFSALLDSWTAIDAERVKEKRKTLEEASGPNDLLMPALRAAATKLTGQTLATRKDWEAWWKEHKKGEWK